MKIWRQNIMAIAPLFLCLALAISGLVYHFVKRELVRGLREESLAAATAISAFSTQLLESELSEQAVARAMERSLSYGTILYAAIYRLDRPNSPLIELGDARVKGEFDQSSNSVIEATTAPFVASTGQTVIGATVPIVLSKSDVNVGKVIVSMNAERLPVGLAEVWSMCLMGIPLTVALGALASGVVSLVLKREMEPLQRAVASVAKGAEETGGTGGSEVESDAKGIREIIDLRNTVATMGSVLEWTMHKSRLMTDSLRTPVTQGSNLPELGLAEELGESGCDVGLHLLPVHSLPGDGTFTLMMRTAAGELIASFGNVGGSGDALERQMRTASAVHYIRQRLSRQDQSPSNSLQRCAALFDLKNLCVIRCAITRPVAFEVFSVGSDGIVAHESHPNNGKMHLIHNGSGDLNDLCEGLTARLPSIPPSELARRVAALITPSSITSGLVIASISFDPATLTTESQAIKTVSTAT